MGKTFEKIPVTYALSQKDFSIISLRFLFLYDLKGTLPKKKEYAFEVIGETLLCECDNTRT